jgi:hypothetical protein
MSRWFVLCIAKAGLFAAIIGFSSAASASVLVLDSSVDGIQRHQELSDDQVVKVPFGRHLSVLVAQDGNFKNVRINGEQEGTVKDLMNPQPVSVRLWNVVKNAVLTGGADLSTRAASRDIPLIVNDVAVKPSVVVCVEERTNPVIRLAPDKNGTSLIIFDASGKQSSRLDLPTGGSSVAWPSEVAVKDNGIYRIIAEKIPQAEITLRVVPSGTLTDVSSLKSLDALNARGCLRQVATAVKKLDPQPN